MMIVVPAFAEGDEGKQQAVATVVVGFKTAFADEMREGIDGGSRVKEHGGADEKAPDDELPGGHAESGMGRVKPLAKAGEQRNERDGNDGVEAVEEDKFGKFREVADLGIIGGEIARAGDPADVRPPETASAGRMDVGFFVGMLVMMAMLIGPPERAPLDGGCADQGE